jgi:hypothetical protein
MSTVCEQSRRCFVFSSKFDAEIYRYLSIHHREEVQRVKERNEAVLGENRLSLSESMDWDLRELFGNQSPIEVTPIDGAYYDGDDIFGDLLSDAIARCDFERIAQAFIENVELPPREQRKGDDHGDE